MVHGENRIPYWIDRSLTGLAEPEYHAILSFGLPIEPEDSQYGEYRLSIWVLRGSGRSWGVKGAGERGWWERVPEGNGPQRPRRRWRWCCVRELNKQATPGDPHRSLGRDVTWRGRFLPTSDWLQVHRPYAPPITTSLLSCSNGFWRARQSQPHLEDGSVYRQVWWAFGDCRQYHF